MQSEEGRRGQEEAGWREAVSVPGNRGKLGLDSTIIVDWIMGGQRRW